MQYRDFQSDSLFLGYQRRWIADANRLKLMEKSRQIGLSWCTAYALVRRKARADAAEGGFGHRDREAAVG